MQGEALLGDWKKGKRDESLRLLNAAVGEAGSSVYVLVRAADLYPVAITANFERLFLLPPSRLEDDIEALDRLLDDDSRLDVRRALASWDRREPLVVDFSFMPDGLAERRRVRCTVSPVQAQEFYLVEFDDLSLEQQRVELLEGQVNSLSSDAQIKADFLNRMSHEIRTPLGGIIGMLTLARDHVGDPVELTEDLDKVDELGNYLLSLVNDILDMSRIESGKVELERKPLDLEALADELHVLFDATAAERGITYEVRLEGCEVRYVLGDRLRLSQVLVNLVSNALKFTPAGGRVDVTFKQMHRTEDSVRIMMRVRDTGKGMDPQFLGRIFRPFEQEDASVAQKFGGSGLGMAIADSLVGLMGGEIVVDSEVGRGSDFCIYLPFGIANGPAPDDGAPTVPLADLKLARMPVATAPVKASKKAEAPVPNPDAPPSLLRGMRVLMAEDNDVNAKITTAMLAKRGAVVERARNGQEAVDLCADGGVSRYGAVLMDIKMPVMDGWTAAGRIRALEGGDRAVIIALSANAYVEDARHSQEMGMDGHVGKPIDFDELEAVLARARARRSAPKVADVDTHDIHDTRDTREPMDASLQDKKGQTL